MELNKYTQPSGQPTIPSGWPSRPPSYPLDDAQRSVLGTFGAGLTLGGIAWAGTVPMGWPLRVLPALAMLVAGGAFLMIALRDHGRDSWRVMLKRAIANGFAIAQLPEDGDYQSKEWRAWQKITDRQLRKDLGWQAAYEFKMAAEGLHRPRAERIAAQIEALEALDRRR